MSVPGQFPLKKRKLRRADGITHASRAQGPANLRAMPVVGLARAFFVRSSRRNNVIYLSQLTVEFWLGLLVLVMYYL